MLHRIAGLDVEGFGAAFIGALVQPGENQFQSVPGVGHVHSFCSGLRGTGGTGQVSSEFSRTPLPKPPGRTRSTRLYLLLFKRNLALARERIRYCADLRRKRRHSIFAAVGGNLGLWRRSCTHTPTYTSDTTKAFLQKEFGVVWMVFVPLLSGRRRRKELLSIVRGALRAKAALKAQIEAVTFKAAHSQRMLK
jgi:hypothetical protein